jgi:class 3 adenylate cyclase
MCGANKHRYAGFPAILSDARRARHERDPEIAAILVSDVVGYGRLAGAEEDRTLARLRALRSDLIDPTISVHHGRIVKRTGDGSVIEFRSVVHRATGSPPLRMAPAR